MKKSTIRISKDLASSIEEEGKFFSSTVEEICQGYIALRDYTLREILKNFTTAEMVAIVDSLNGVMLDGRLRANVHVAVANLEDHEEFNNGISVHGADPEVLLNKYKKLTAAQVYFLQNEVRKYWEMHSDKSIEEYFYQK